MSCSIIGISEVDFDSGGRGKAGSNSAKYTRAIYKKTGADHAPLLSQIICIQNEPDTMYRCFLRCCFVVQDNPKQ